MKEIKPMDLKNFHSEHGFWKDEMELVRQEMIPYQWEILNDRVEDAAPSYCIRNFKIAAKLVKEQHTNRDFVPPKYTFRGFEALPEDKDHLEDKFYGFVFQDSDLYKWIEAVAYSLVQHPDPELEKTADEAIDLICSAQLDSGYLDTYYIINGMDQAFTNTKDHHEMYCFGHMAEAAVAYYEATGHDKFLRAVCKFADYIGTVFGPEEGQKHGYPGHEIAEMALIRLYEVTKESSYLELASYFIDERGKKPYYWFGEENDEPRTEGDHFMYYQAHKPVRQQTEAIGHAVRAVYLYSGMTDVARLKGDQELWHAVTTLWNSAINRQMYITGAIGATSIGESFSYEYDLPNDLVYGESCASIGLIFWARRMLEMDVNGKYADAMELALYNTVLSGMALDGKSFFYVNPLEVNPRDCHLDLRKQHVKTVRQKWFGCACCPPNIARLISSIPSYAYTESEDTLYMHLHITGDVEKTVTEKRVLLHVESALPWNGNVDIDCVDAQDVEMTVAIRIPSWAQSYEVSGVDAFKTHVDKGYLYIKGLWKTGQRIRLVLPMEPKVLMADTRVREDQGKVAYMRGPITYCVEQNDNGGDLHLLQVLPQKPIQESRISIQGQEFPALQVEAKRQVKVETEGGLYQQWTPPVYKRETLTLIPYYTWANRGENEMMVWLRAEE